MSNRGTYVRWFEELGVDDVAGVGGKNASLGELLRKLGEAGVRVPGGFATTADAYREFVAQVGAVASFFVRARRKYSGQIALFALGVFGVGRYLIEDSFRYDMTAEVAGPITLGQVTGVVIVAVVVTAHVMRLNKLAEDPTGMMQWTGGPWTPGSEETSGKKKSGKKKSGKKKSGKKKSSKKKSSKKSGNTSAEKSGIAAEGDAKTEGGTTKAGENPN